MLAKAVTLSVFGRTPAGEMMSPKKWMCIAVASSPILEGESLRLRAGVERRCAVDEGCFGSGSTKQLSSR